MKIGDIVKRIDKGNIYVVASLPGTAGGCELVKIAPVPDDGLYLIDDVQGGIKTNLLVKVDFMICKYCKWYANFEGVCCNGKSKHCADFVGTDDFCWEWEQ